MTVLASLVAGAVVGFAALVATGDLFGSALFLRTNYRGRRVPVGVGILIPLTLVVVVTLAVVGRELGDWPASADLRRGEVAMMVAALGLGFLGIFDDLAASGDTRGFAGHLRSVASGSFTTGAVKLVGGGLVGIYAASLLDDPGLVGLLVDGALIALMANVGNLFDRAPGRCTKVTGLLFVVVAGSTGAPEELTGAAIVVGAGIGLLGADLAERIMLGDAGANVLGGAVGVALVAGLPPIGRVMALALALAVNLASERISFSEVIDHTPVLRYLDHIGRRRT